MSRARTFSFLYSKLGISLFLWLGECLCALSENFQVSGFGVYYEFASLQVLYISTCMAYFSCKLDTSTLFLTQAYILCYSTKSHKT